MGHSFAGCASTARSTFPMSARENEFPLVGSDVGWRTFLSVPLRQQGELIGTLNARRIEVRPFTPAQIKLLETFADQAVIAIENVRLFKSSRNRWNSKLRRVKSWVSSPAHRPTSSQCWTPLLRVRLGCAGPMTQPFDLSRVTLCPWWRTTGRFPLERRAGHCRGARSPAEAMLQRKQSIFRTC